VQYGTAHVNHSIARHCCWRRVVNVVNFKDDLAGSGHRDTITVRQRQGLVVVKHRVEILDPDCVDWTVQD